MKKYFLFFLTTLLFSCHSNKPAAILDGSSLLEMDVQTLSSMYQNGSISIVEVVEKYIERIEKIDPLIHSIIAINPDALAIAAALDQELKNGKYRGTMHGVPVLLKDNIDTHDKMPTTAGSRALANSYPMHDSFIATKLRESGAVILGKANLSEWANFRGMKSTSGWSGIGGQTNNPYVLSANPCGSSAGSGASVSANLCMLAIGTETNGSIVCPSNANGIVGIKPTVGLASRTGIIPISFTQDTPGPMARSVRDAAICLSVITGEDPQDSKTKGSTSRVHKDYTQFLTKNGIRAKRIGVFTGPYGIESDVDGLFDNAKIYFESQGATLVRIDSILSSSVDEASFELMLFEYKDGLNKYFESLGPNSQIKSVDDLILFNKKDDIELEYFKQEFLHMANEKGSLESMEFIKALETARKGSQDQGIDRVMDKHNLDAIISITGSPAWKTDYKHGDRYTMGSSSPAAISGYPSITVPMGFVGELPVGISIFGRAWSEPILLEIAYSYEQGTMHRKVPKFIE